MANTLSFRIQRLNHAVLYVSDLERSIDFYATVLGFNVIACEGTMAFLRAPGSDNHHDLGLMGLGAHARPAPQGSTGLYHLAWQVGSMEELAAVKMALARANAFSGESDHGATQSIYALDPDGNEFEVMVLLPREKWGDYEHRAPVMPLRW